jgi:type III secretory pathway component EscS
MNMAITLEQITVIVIIGLCIVVLQGLSALYYQTKEWRFLSLMIIPAAFCLVYIWVGVARPTAAESRDIVRSVIILGGMTSTHVIFTYLRRLRNLPKRKEDIKG